MRLTGVSLVALLFALVSGMALLIAGSVSLVSEQGSGVIAVLAIPLLITVIVGVALWFRSRSGVLIVAWTFTGLLALFNLLAMLTIGVFVLPVTAALIVACATCGAHVGAREVSAR